MRVVNSGIDDAVNVLPTDSTTVRQRRPRRKLLVGAYASLLLFMVIYCARPEDWIPGLSVVPLAKIAGILALGALAVSLQHIRQRLPREVIFLMLLVGQMFVAAALSPVWRGGAFQLTLDFSKVLIVVLMINSAVSTSQRLRALIFTQALSVSAIAFVIIWKGRLLSGRLEGIFGGNYSDPNDLALAIIISLPLCSALLFVSRNRLWKTLWSISIFVMLCAVFMTGSRGGFLALLITTAVFLWEFAIRGRRRYLLVFAAIAGLILFQFVGGLLFARLQGIVNPDESVQQRQQLFWRSIEVTKEHPLFGVGQGNFQEVSGVWHVAHNSFTEMSADGGVPAFVLYVLILWSGFKNLRATKRLARGHTESVVMARALLASLAGYVVGSSFLSDAFQFFPYILVAYTSVLFSIEKKSAAKNRELELISRRALTAKSAEAEESLKLSLNFS
jgi:putative inorganic carbon (HCO3(-)) transporter